MKKLIIFLGLVMVSHAAFAQFLGLPIADSAGAPATGETRVSAGAVLGDDVDLYGGRLFFAPIRPLGIFADLGALNPNGGDVGWAFQLGGKYTLPLKESPMDVALRAVWDRASFDLDAGKVTSSGFNVGVLVGREVEVFSPYAFLGLNFVDSEVKIKGGGKATDDSTDLALAVGTLIRLSAQISVYVEAAYVDDPFFGFGLRWAL